MDLRLLEPLIKSAQGSDNPYLKTISSDLLTQLDNLNNRQDSGEDELLDTNMDSSSVDEEGNLMEPVFEELDNPNTTPVKSASLWDRYRVVTKVVKKASDAPRDFGCLMLYTPEEVNRRIRLLQNSIDKADLYTEDGENKYGLEDEHHVTALYGLWTKDPKVVEGVVGRLGKGKITGRIFKTSIFENDKYDVLKYDVSSDDLHELNKLLRKDLKYTPDFPKYHPHLTIGYLKKGKGKKYSGRDMPDTTNEGFEFESSDLVYSCDGKEKTHIVLSSKKGLAKLSMFDRLSRI